MKTIKLTNEQHEQLRAVLALSVKLIATNANSLPEMEQSVRTVLALADAVDEATGEKPAGDAKNQSRKNNGTQ